MRVLHLISSGGFFGAERVVVTLAREQIKQGLGAYVGVFKNYNNPHLEVAQNAHKCNLPVEIFDCKGRFDIKTILSIRYFLRENKIDIIHSHGYKSNFYGLLSSLNMGIKNVATCHTWYSISLKLKFYERVDKLLLKRFNKVIAISEELKHNIIECGISKKKILVIDNGIDIGNEEEYQKQGTEALGHKGKIEPDGGERMAKDRRVKIREEFGIRKDEKVVGIIGRLANSKGHIYFLEAAKKILTVFPNTKFLIVGDGPLMKDLKLKVGSLRLENKVIFTGIRRDIPEILDIIDVFVMSSLKEGMPIVLLEAMAARKPIVATRVGAIPEIIKDGYTGLLVEPGDEKKLADLIVGLLKDKEKASFLAQNGYEKVINEFSSKKMAEKYIKIYKSIYERIA